MSVYFLYFHTFKNLLKACLKAHGKERWGHEISELRTDKQRAEVEEQTAIWADICRKLDPTRPWISADGAIT
jgi:FAD/FMN-containing dehydrogenase